MMKPLGLLLSLAVLACAAAAARAGELDHDNELSFRLGAYGSGSELEVNGKERVADGGGIGAFRYLLNLDKNAAIGVDAVGLDAGHHDSQTLMTGFNTRTALKHSELLALLRGRFGQGRLRPYVLGGLGIHTTTFQLNAAPNNGSTWSGGGTESRSLMDDKKSGLATEVELGLDYLFTNHLTAGAFFGLHLQSERTYDAKTQGKAVGLAGIKGSFGGLALGLSLAGRF